MAIESDEEAVAAAKAVGVDMEKVEPTWVTLCMSASTRR